MTHGSVSGASCDRQKEQRSRSGEASDSQKGTLTKRFRTHKSTHSNQTAQGTHEVHSSMVNQCKLNSGVASIVCALLRIPTFAKSSIPGSAVQGKVEELEGRIKVIGKELNESNANHAILDYQASAGALLFT